MRKTDDASIVINVYGTVPFVPGPSRSAGKQRGEKRELVKTNGLRSTRLFKDTRTSDTDYMIIFRAAAGHRRVLPKRMRRNRAVFKFSSSDGSRQKNRHIVTDRCKAVPAADNQGQEGTPEHVQAQSIKVIKRPLDSR